MAGSANIINPFPEPTTDISINLISGYGNLNENTLDKLWARRTTSKIEIAINQKFYNILKDIDVTAADYSKEHCLAVKLYTVFDEFYESLRYMTKRFLRTGEI